MEFFQYPATLLCAARDQLSAVLKGKHGEVPTVRGISGDGAALFEIWESLEKTWSAVLIAPSSDGGQMMCLVASGTDLMRILGETPGVPL